MDSWSMEAQKGHAVRKGTWSKPGLSFFLFPSNIPGAINQARQLYLHSTSHTQRIVYFYSTSHTQGHFKCALRK